VSKPLAKLYLEAFSNFFFWPLPCRRHCTAAGDTGTTSCPQPWHYWLGVLPMPLSLMPRGTLPTDQLHAVSCVHLGQNPGTRQLYFPPAEGECGKVALTGIWKRSSGGSWSFGARASLGWVPDASVKPGMRQSISIPTGLSQDLLFTLE